MRPTLPLVGVLVAAVLCACNGGMSSEQSMQSASQPNSSNPGVATLSQTPCTPASPSGGPYCLTFAGAAYDVHIGQKFKVAVVTSDGTNTVIQAQVSPVLPAAVFYINLPQSLTANVSYYVDYYADNDRNGICDGPVPPPPTTDLSHDHVWRSHTMTDFYHGTIVTVEATSGDIVLTAPHDDTFINDPNQITCGHL